MNYSTQLKRIRMLLRDPDGNIWSDTELKRLFNDEQLYLQHQTSILEKIQPVRVPPQYLMSYLYDWEWQYEDEGKKYQALQYYHQSNTVIAHRWESYVSGGINVTESSNGEIFIHPWEAWYADTIGALVPIPFPADFYKAKFVAWDREPIDYKPIKEIQEDQSWATRSGKVQYYTRFDDLSNEMILYPLPADPVFDDIEGDALTGLIMSDDDNTEDSEYGLILVETGYETISNYGIATDTVKADDNLLIVYDCIPTDISDDDQESDFPIFMRKYIQYGVLERAFAANTDGNIESLRDYWASRKKIGLEAIKRLKWTKKTDRDYCLKTKGAPGFRTTRQPRLPDEYPAVW